MQGRCVKQDVTFCINFTENLKKKSTLIHRLLIDFFHHKIMQKLSLSFDEKSH